MLVIPTKLTKMLKILVFTSTYVIHSSTIVIKRLYESDFRFCETTFFTLSYPVLQLLLWKIIEKLFKHQVTQTYSCIGLCFMKILYLRNINNRTSPTSDLKDSCFVHVAPNSKITRTSHQTLLKNKIQYNY